MLKAGNRKIKEIRPSELYECAQALLAEDEEVLSAYKNGREQIIFTSSRFVIIGVLGMSGHTAQCLSVPYSKIQAFQIDITKREFDHHPVLSFACHDLGHFTFEINGYFDLGTFNNIMAHYLF